jgi:hypothetical protein
MPFLCTGLRIRSVSLLLGISLLGRSGTAIAQETAPPPRITLAESAQSTAPVQVDEPIPVIIDADRPVEIFENPLDGSDERRVVSTDTTAGSGSHAESRLTPHSRFRVGGPGVASTDFMLGEAKAVQLKITTGNLAKRIAGATIGIASIVIAAAGPWLLLAGAATRSPGNSAVGPPGWQPLSTQLFTSGGVLLSVGVMGLFVGWGCYRTARTRVEISPLYPSAALTPQ